MLRNGFEILVLPMASAEHGRLKPRAREGGVGEERTQSLYPVLLPQIEVREILTALLAHFGTLLQHQCSPRLMIAGGCQNTNSNHPLLKAFYNVITSSLAWRATHVFLHCITKKKKGIFKKKNFSKGIEGIINHSA